MKIIRFSDTALVGSLALDMSCEKIVFAYLTSPKEASLRSVSASINLGDHGVLFNHDNLNAEYDVLNKHREMDLRGEKQSYSIYIEKIAKNKRNYYSSMVISRELTEDKGKYFISWDGDVLSALYNKLNVMFTLPILPEWSEYFYRMLTQNDHLEELVLWSDADIANVKFGEHSLCSAKIFRLMLGEKQFEDIISQGLKDGEIYISKTEQKPLSFKNLDEYYKNYGHTAVDNLMKLMQPLTERKGKVNVIFKKKRLFPKQAAVVNGLTELLKTSNYGLINAGMGCGKSFMSIATVEKKAQDDLRVLHPDWSAGELSKNAKYRTIVMAPGHLIHKWAREIKDEVPLAKVQVITDLEQVARLTKEASKKPDGKYFYVISKDFAKLNYQTKPAVTKLKKRKVMYVECEHCGDTSTTIHQYKTKAETLPMPKGRGFYST